jgi:hypothetical protein
MLTDDIKNISSTKKDLKKFGISVGLVFIAISLILFLLSSKYFFHVLVSGTFLTLSGYFLPIILYPAHKAWMTISIILGWISTRVILIILYYLILTPIGLAVKLMGKDFLNVKFEKSKTSYWNQRDQNPYDKLDSERQF